MRPETIPGEIMSAQIAKAFEAALAADVYAVLHLNRELDGIRADRSIYVRQVVGFMERLAKRCRGKTQYRRLPHLHRFLPNAVTIEKIADGPHLNVMIQKPLNWPFDDFHKVFATEWLKSPWAATDERAVYIARRKARSNLIGYTHKEGDESLVLETLRFSAC
jgi:hypothetical protein